VRSLGNGDFELSDANLASQKKERLSLFFSSGFEYDELWNGIVGPKE